MPWHFFWDRRIRARRRRARLASRASWVGVYRPALVSGAYCLAIFVLHTLAMMQFEGMSVGDGLWLTLTTITTVGYGDVSAASWQGRVATVVLVYMGGIFVVAKVVGDLFDYRATRREAMNKGNWDWSGTRNHIVVVGSSFDSEHHLARLFAEFERNDHTSGRDIVLLSPAFTDGLPASLRAMGVRYLHGSSGNPELLDRAGIADADIIVLLAADARDSASDGVAFDIVHRIRDVNHAASVVTECVEDSNRPRLLRAGATLCVRPVRAYPEMLVNALLQPGVIEILENLFTMDGEQIDRIEGEVKALWKDVVVDHVERDLGLPIAYQGRGNGKIVTAPRSGVEVDAEAIFVLRGSTVTAG